MLGPAKRRLVHDSVTVSLDDLVPADHFYRHLDACLDLSFVRDWVHDTCSSIGRPSVDPVVVCKLYLVMVFEGIRSERQLLMLAADRLGPEGTPALVSRLRPERIFAGRCHAHAPTPTSRLVVLPSLLRARR